MDIRKRFAIAAVVKEEYEDFRVFARAGMAFLGFPLTDMQEDIAEFMANGPRLRMVMAQRGEAKSTLAALYAVWRIIQDCQTRVLIISGGEKQASEVANLVVRMIMVWDILAYLRPEKAAGDRTSYTDFDVHYALKGLDKSPSVACVGITANLQGKRAHLLIPDDIETTKNGLTVTQREHLLTLTREFTSINSDGDILYLGTPQTKDSIYNTLPARGFEVRIWPGRFPTNEELEKYGERLAPFLADRIAADPSLQHGGGLDGKRGQPADPQRFNEAALVEKELDQGPEGFQLQFMLDTSLADAARRQLKLSDLLVAAFDSEMLPEHVLYQAAITLQVELPRTFPVPMTKMYRGVVPPGVGYAPRKDVRMHIDPAGGGGDELAFAVGCSLGPYIHWLDIGGWTGGLTDEVAAKLADIVLRWDVTYIQIESNGTQNLFERNLRASFAELAKVDEDKYGKLKLVGMKGEWSAGQKERRIINSIVSTLQRHRIIVHQSVFDSDAAYSKHYSLEKRNQRSVFFQMENITSDARSLPKDDRLDALSGLMLQFKGVIEEDADKAAEARAVARAQEHMQNPMGYEDPFWASTSETKLRGTRAHIAKRRRI